MVGRSSVALARHALKPLARFRGELGVGIFGADS